jgi:hypothetical protein
MARMSIGAVLGCLLFATSLVAADDLWVQAGTTQAQPARPTESPTAPTRPARPADAPAAPTERRTTPTPPANREEQQPEANRTADSLARAPTETGEAPTGVNHEMLGDFPGFCVPRLKLVPALRTTTFTQNVSQTTFVSVPSFIVTQQVQTIPITVNGVPQKPIDITIPVLTPTTVQVPVTTLRPVTVRRQVPVNVLTTVCSPEAFSGAFKVADNESPAPADRAFFTYNYYSTVRGIPSGPHQETFTTIINGNPATVTTQVPGVTTHVDVHRETAGFEKTFFDGSASFGLRAPVVEQVGGDAFAGNDFGDLTFLFKYAFLHDGQTGDTLSAGLALTVPTGPGLSTLQGDLHPVILQPFAGAYWSADRFYVHGFTSLAVPTEARDVTLLFNDVGVGYAVYRGAETSLVSGVVPTLEAHVTTPLNNRGDSALVRVPDLVVLTAGSHFDLFQRARLTLGVATPVTGPRVFDVEALVQFNWRF